MLLKQTVNERSAGLYMVCREGRFKDQRLTRSPTEGHTQFVFKKNARVL